MKKKENEKNFLDFIPVRKIEWAQNQEGKVYLVKEKSKNRLVNKMIDLTKRSRVFHIHLDDIGSAVWLGMDGSRTVNEICGLMKQQFGEGLEKAEERVCYFLGMLKRNDFVDLRDKENINDFIEKGDKG